MRFAEFFNATLRRERSAEFNFDSKILFNLWGWLCFSQTKAVSLPMDRSTVAFEIHVKIDF
ncbi:hypothetical protein APS47_15920 [Leptospira kirschneri serovar Mozdok]|nr:hypothetical protein APS47_15920 [Leptospira kirschneri serovar Mozdok]